MCRSARSFFSIVFLINFSLSVTAVSHVYADWEFQDSGVDVWLWDVCFVDEYHGWAVGSNSTILATVDGGKIWVKQISPITDTPFSDVFFINENVGFCIGKKIFLKTYNGGKNWVAKETGFERLHDIFFLNENEGWMVGSSYIAKTNDGGETWKVQIEIKEPYVFFSIFMLNKYTGWGLGGYYGDQFNESYVFHTTDGGDVWSEISEIRSPPTNKIVAVSPDTLWAYGQGCISLSYDGGFTWKRKTSPVFPSNSNVPLIEPRDMCPINGQQAYVIFRDFQEERNILRFTNDGGETYSDLFNIPYTFLTAIHRSGERLIWGVGSQGSIVKFNLEPETGIIKIDKMPEVINLKQNYPNPFNNFTVINFSLTIPDNVTLIIYNIIGKKITELHSGKLLPGNYSVIWDGKDDVSGSYVSSGIYLYELRTTKHSVFRRMLLSR